MSRAAMLASFTAGGEGRPGRPALSRRSHAVAIPLNRSRQVLVVLVPSQREPAFAGLAVTCS
jgi:hypothetical protein